MSPSDSLSTRRDFTDGLYAPPSPSVGRRVGPPQFRIRLSLRALFHTPEASCTSPVHRCSLLPSPGHDWLGRFPFRVLISRGCKVHAFALGPQVCSPGEDRTVLARAFDAPHRRAISRIVWSLLRGAPALTAAGLTPASLMQHLRRAVQTRPRSGRSTARQCTRTPRPGSARAELRCTMRRCRRGARSAAASAAGTESSSPPRLRSTNGAS